MNNIQVMNRNVSNPLASSGKSDQIQTEAKDFYARQAKKFAHILDTSWSTYTNVSHPGFKDDLDLIRQVKELVAPGAKGIDAGCGPLGREVFQFHQDGYDMYGMDVVLENIQTALEYHPELSDRLYQADLTQPLNFADASFDFIMCNTVIQHINLDSLTKVTFPEFARILKPGGIMQLMFRSGDGTQRIEDIEFDYDERSYYLYQPERILDLLKNHGLSLVPEVDGSLGGVIYVTDVRPMENCFFCVRKDSET